MDALQRKGITIGLPRVTGDYLKGRSIRLEAGTDSATIEVNREVPQGSVMGGSGQEPNIQRTPKGNRAKGTSADGCAGETDATS